MVLSSAVVVTVARVSAEAWQWVTCTEERLSSDEFFDLLCFFPFHQLGRIAICFCSFLCLPQTYFISDSDSDSFTLSRHSSSSSSNLNFDDFHYHSHSD